MTDYLKDKYEALAEAVKSDSEFLEPETLRNLFPEITEKEFNKTMAMTVLSKNDFFWNNMYIFEDVTLALNAEVPSFTRLEGCSPEQIWYSTQIAARINPKAKYSHEVKTYIKYMSNEAGVYIYPPTVGLSNILYEAAAHLAANGPFPLGEDTKEEIQAAKLLAIEHYLETYAQ